MASDTTATDSDKMAGADTSTSAGSNAAGEIQIARSFFTMSADDILASCAGNDDLSAAQVINSAQNSAR
jgi:hypothetical protein